MAVNLLYFQKGICKAWVFAVASYYHKKKQEGQSFLHGFTILILRGFKLLPTPPAL